MNETKRLYKSRTDKMLGGVCSGIAKYFNIDPTLVRVGFAVITFFSIFFGGILLYILLLIIVPEEPA